MNIAGFILFSLFAAFFFWLAYLQTWEPKGDYAKMHSATATVSYTETHRDKDGDAHGYRYVVIFTDYYGKESVGRSEVFTRKRILESGQMVEVYYWKEEETEFQRKATTYIERAMDTIVSALGGEYEPDTRPQYSIHFCNENLYTAEKKSDRRSSIAFRIMGCVMLIPAVLSLLGFFN